MPKITFIGHDGAEHVVQAEAGISVMKAAVNNMVPGIDAGNMLAKQLSFVSHAEGAGLVLGARVPVILNSRSDSPMSRLASCAVASLHHAFAGERSR